MKRIVALLLAAAAVSLVSGAGRAGASGDDFVQFPRDEHQHIDGWDYWWGAGDFVTRSGARYTVTFAYTSWDGVGFSGVQLFPHDGPYAGQSVLTVDGPAEWGHPETTMGGAPRVVHRMSAFVPSISELVTVEALDAFDSLKRMDAWERTSARHPEYRLSVDQDDAKLHPAGQSMRFGLKLDIAMRKRRPLLAGGTGRWWYGIPETYGYPSRSFQYMQAAREMGGTVELELPDGSIRRERLRPAGSRFLIVHEYDATPEDIPAGLAIAEATQLHPRYPQYYGLDWPWELVFADLGNGAQLMVAVMRFDDTEMGLVRPLGGNQPKDRVLATLRTPDGRSVPLDDQLNVEHLEYRTTDPRYYGQGPRTLYTQAWKLRVSHEGGTARAPGGRRVRVPPFDLGLVPRWDRDEPAEDASGARLVQRIPFAVQGSYAGCPVDGFAFSELLVNWHGRKGEDPYRTRGSLPQTPRRCHAPSPPPPPGERVNADPSGPGTSPPLNTTTGGCSAGTGGPPTCEFTATGPGATGGYSEAPGDWTTTITRPGEPEPLTIRSHGGFEVYPCTTIQAGDHVVATAAPNAAVYAGNPGLCL